MHFAMKAAIARRHFQVTPQHTAAMAFATEQIQAAEVLAQDVTSL
jgi:hypothetical protein